MEINFLRFAFRAGGVLPLLIFFVVSVLCWYCRNEEWGKSFRSLLLLHTLLPSWVLLNLILYPLLANEWRLGDMALLSVSGAALFTLSALTIPVFSSLYETVSWGQMRVGVMISGVIMVAVSILFWFGDGLIAWDWLIFSISFGAIFLWIIVSVKRGKSWSEVVSLLANTHFVLGFSLLLASTLALAVIFMMEWGCVPILLTCAIISAVSYLVMMWQVRWNYIFEELVGSYSLQQNPRQDFILSDECGFASMYGFKNRLFTLFDEQKPYLSPEFTITKLSGMLYTNKSYISKFLNNDIKMNFKEFVNQYRVKEAIRLYKDDPSLTLKQLYQMCGFRNNTSFTNAFRMYTGMTPGEWCRNVKKGCGDEKAQAVV